MLILVMGMHRSGTSALAGMLHEGGVFMGARLVGKSNNNLKGHYEDKLLLRLDNKILDHLNGSWRNVPKITGQEQLPDLLIEKMKNLTNSYSDHSIRGWKDPRLSVLFPLWYEAVLHTEDIVFLHITRHSQDVVRSLQKRHDDFSEQKALDLWRLYNHSIKSNAEKYHIPTLLINFEELVEFPTKVKERIETFTGISLLDGACEFIDKGLKHWNTSLSNSRDKIDRIIDNTNH